MCTIPLLRKVCRESYNQPLEVYEKLKRLGMDLVTVTDHDSIDAVEELRSRPDFFLSEEVTCTLPGGNQLHVGVMTSNERDHVNCSGDATISVFVGMAADGPVFQRQPYSPAQTDAAVENFASSRRPSPP
jgi:hypothetical protein